MIINNLFVWGIGENIRINTKREKETLKKQMFLKEMPKDKFIKNKDLSFSGVDKLKDELINKGYMQFLKAHKKFSDVIKNNNLVETQNVVINWLKKQKDLTKEIEIFKKLNEIKIFEDKEVKTLQKYWPFKCTNEQLDKYMATITDFLLEYDIQKFINAKEILKIVNKVPIISGNNNKYFYQYKNNELLGKLLEIYNFNDISPMLRETPYNKINKYIYGNIKHKNIENDTISNKQNEFLTKLKKSNDKSQNETNITIDIPELDLDKFFL